VRNIFLQIKSEEHELLSDVTDNFVGDDLKDVERDGLAKGSALTDDDDVSFLNSEGGGDVYVNILVSLFVSVVLGDVVEVISSDDDCSLHFG
jgi:hypothetical protein